MSINFELGQIVQLRSGGPTMTVTAVELVANRNTKTLPPHSTTLVYCTYFNLISGEFCHDQFSDLMLKSAETCKVVDIIDAHNIKKRLLLNESGEVTNIESPK